MKEKSHFLRTQSGIEVVSFGVGSLVFEGRNWCVGSCNVENLGLNQEQFVLGQPKLMNCASPLELSAPAKL